MKVHTIICMLITLSSSALADAVEDDPDYVSGNGLKLIELFTSHGCSSCPPADALLGELLAADDQLLALEYHVDYWNTLIHGNDGSFQDPFSDASYSTRQREYNAANLKGRPGVYTPQAVINGRFATVGSNRQVITSALGRPAEQALSISFEASTEGNSLNVSVSGSQQQRQSLEDTAISMVYYLDSATTEVTGGENRHKTLINHHIVTRHIPLGKVSSSAEMTFSVARPGSEEGCVVMVQERALTPVYAAAACP